MFPDVRLMIGAIMASIVTLGCGFAVFAAFRVNHEPLAHFSSISAPVPLVADSAAPRVAPFPGGEARGSRFEMTDGAITGSIPSAPLPIRPRDAQPQMAAAAAPAQAPFTVAPAQPTDSAAAPPPSAGAPIAATVGNRPDQVAVTEQPAVEAKPTPTAAIATASPAAAVGSPDAASEEPTKAEPAKPEPVKLETTKSEQGPPDAPRAAIQASQDAQEKPEQKPAAVADTDAARVDDDAVAAAHAAAPDSVGRQRLVSGVARRGRRMRIVGVAPPNSYNSLLGQTNFQSTQSNFRTQQANAESGSSFFATQPTPPAPRRVVRRFAAAPKPVAAKPAAVGGPFVSPPVPPVR